MNPQLTKKIQEFTKLALDRVDALEREVAAHRIAKEAQEQEEDEALMDSLEKAAEALYESDFITTKKEKAAFIKKAKADPLYLSGFIGKICAAADVAYMGKPSTIRHQSKFASDDPVMVRAGLATAAVSGLVDED